MHIVRVIEEYELHAMKKYGAETVGEGVGFLAKDSQ